MPPAQSARAPSVISIVPTLTSQAGTDQREGPMVTSLRAAYTLAKADIVRHRRSSGASVSKLVVTALTTSPNIAYVDDVYQWLIDALADREEDEALRFNSRLILILMNHIGDEAVIRAAIDLAAITP